jgi:DNA polymerase-3 subunit alpha
MPDFSHLHVHTQFSLLDGAASITEMMKKAQADNMKAIAITDHGNMFGAFKFVAEANKYNIKPIVGCEFYVVNDRHLKQFTKDNTDTRHHQLFLAKDQDGYKNLSKLCSLGYMEGLYSKWPRIDKELILKYHKGLIATTCCIGAEVPQAILNKGEAEAEKIFKWWLDLFGEDYYIELQRHALPEQEKVNEVLLRFAAKYNVKIICSNDSHYVNQEDSNAHDILLCINTGDMQKTPIGDGKGFRFGFPNNEFYFKKQDEMAKLFHDLPQALDNTNEIVDKITPPKLKRDILLPNFPLPPEFSSLDDFLKHLTMEGARKRYKEFTQEVEERLNHELHIIKTMGFAGYFLIVADFIKAGRDMGVLIGPGRGSAAGSAVAYCIGITNIDPIKYNLLFERFLNPERVTMPDIDTDFDDEGRQKVIDYVVEKYGKNQVAQIVTYGSMAAKMSIKDVARALDLPLDEANLLTKMVPDTPGISLKDAFSGVAELKEIRKGNDLKARVLATAEVLEGSVRNTGTHASAVIIAPDDLTEYIPVCISKDSELLITQFDGKVVEDAGMLKMDFLGLKTLTIIKDAMALIKINHGIDIDIDDIPLDDAKTFELYQKGETVGTFQFESDGMRKYLKELKPTNIEDLIAMNALYRPGPMDFIPLYINRKNGREKIEYPHELLIPLLQNTNGIMVYQEQIMQTAQVIAGYSLGGADLLRRAMGKKDKEKMAKERDKFVKGAEEIHGIKPEKANDIFNIMEKFAEYGFNRSHSAAYSVVAYQTAYLKANYPGEYMSAVLTNNMSDIKKITFFMEECKRHGVAVLGPDINESILKFNVNKKGEIRFGLAAIKGVGEAAVEAIVMERGVNGPFLNIFDLTKRMNLKAANRKTLESLACAGAFDCFKDVHRAQYFTTNGTDEVNSIEKAIKFGSAFQANESAAQHSLFGGAAATVLSEPSVPLCEPWGMIEQLKREKDVIGMYISGHPLDEYKLEVETFCDKLTDLQDLPKLKGKELSLAGIVTSKTHRVTKTGNPFGLFTLEDYSGAYEFALFSKDYVEFEKYMKEGLFLYIKGKVQGRFKQEDNLEFKIGVIELLPEVKDRLLKSITLHLNLTDINPDTIGVMQKIISENPGNCDLKIKVLDKHQNLSVNLLSSKFKVRVGSSVLSTIESQNIAFKIN